MDLFSERVRIAAGRGTDRFTMTKGSFDYRTDVLWEHSLAESAHREFPGGEEVLFTDAETGETYRAVITKNGGDGLFRLVPPEGSDANRFRVTFCVPEGAHFYGCGETYSEFDLAGQTVRVWTAEHQNERRIAAKKEKLAAGTYDDQTALPFSEYESYYVQPTFVCSDESFVHVDTSRFAEFDFTVPGRVTILTEEPPVILCANAGSFAELSAKQADFFGHRRKIPAWVSEGAIIARQRGTESVQDAIDTAKAAGVPLVGIWSQDWCGCRKTAFGYQVMWNWEYDRQLYHDLPEKIRGWKAAGVRFLGYINPFLALEKNLYAEASAKGYCVKNAAGEDYLVTITTFPAAMVDFTNPAAWEWYKNVIKKNMIGIGLSGWMADFGEYLPADCVLFSGQSAEEMHNLWPALWAKLNREAVEESGLSDEIFFFMRAGFTGNIADCCMMWTGDQHVDWSVDDGLPSVIPATLSLGMSGYPMAHSDVGGYTTNECMTRSPELLMRWEEMCAFSPVFRSHEGNQPVRNVHLLDENAQADALCGEADALRKHLARCASWFAALAPYRKACEEEAVKAGIPVMRPLFYHYDEPRAYIEKAEYLLGRDILTAPVIRPGAVTREVYLPEDRWVHLWSGKEYGGGVHSVDAPIGRPSVFVRKDALPGLSQMVQNITKKVRPKW